MAEAGDEVLLECASCGEDEQEVLRAAPSGWTLRCLSCSAVRTVPAPPQERFVQVPIIVSEGAQAHSSRIDVPLDTPVMVGDEVEHDGQRVRITGIEGHDGSRPAQAAGRDIKVLHAVRFDTVRLHYSVNQGEVTRSFAEEVDPDVEVEVGEVREVQGVRLLVKTLKSDQNRTLHQGFLRARNIRRVFADLAPKDARPGERRKVRRRGAAKPPPGRKPSGAGGRATGGRTAGAKRSTKRSVAKAAPRKPRRSRRA
ncbi:MAG TPA: HVO_0476 family zinc finger protein [Candidatus Thermoplasmatota archaeon]|nr:HVO_0476 family zinc finger protein [Candidatus Thermoplasmatota archaeon]